MENENGDGINAGGMCKCAGDSQLIVYFHLFFPMLIVLETNLASISNFYRLDNMRILWKESKFHQRKKCGWAFPGFLSSPILHWQCKIDGLCWAYYVNRNPGYEHFVNMLFIWLINTVPIESILFEVTKPALLWNPSCWSIKIHTTNQKTNPFDFAHAVIHWGFLCRSRMHEFNAHNNFQFSKSNTKSVTRANGLEFLSRFVNGGLLHKLKLKSEFGHWHFQRDGNKALK